MQWIPKVGELVDFHHPQNRAPSWSGKEVEEVGYLDDETPVVWCVGSDGAWPISMLTKHNANDPFTETDTRTKERI